MNRLCVIALIAAGVLVAGCSSADEKAARLCPQTAIVRDLGRINDYGNDMPEEKSLVATVVMDKVQGTCQYSDEGVDVDFRLTMTAMRGPRLGGNRIGVPYFISVLDSGQAILTKDIMTADITFNGDERRGATTEDLHVFVPIPSDVDASNYQVLMGFQLTEAQLEENRRADDKSLRSDKNQ
jgi:hypothetical protein